MEPKLIFLLKFILFFILFCSCIGFVISPFAYDKPLDKQIKIAFNCFVIGIISLVLLLVIS